MISSRVQEELAQTQRPVVEPSVNMIITSTVSAPMMLNYGITFGYTPDQRVQNRGKAWTKEEHERFLVALEMYPRGPWKAIAAHVGTKTARQAMTHSQKCREKIARRRRALEQQLAQIQLARDETVTALAMPSLPMLSGPSAPVKLPTASSPTSHSSPYPDNVVEMFGLEDCLMLFHPEAADPIALKTENDAALPQMYSF